MKKFKIFIASVIFMAMFSSMAMAQDRGNLGFAFGTSFQKHQKNMLLNGGMNYFRLYMKGDRGLYYFLHTENGSFMVDEGDVNSTSQKEAKAIGVSLALGLVSLDVMVGNATVKLNQEGVPIVGPNIEEMDSSDPFVDIGVRYSYVKNNASLDLNFSYRYHTISNEIAITDVLGNEEDINDLSSINLGVGISCMF